MFASRNKLRKEIIENPFYRFRIGTKKRSMENARLTSYKILYDVLYKGAYSNIAINQSLRKSALQNQERGFVTELVYGTLEKKIFLEYVIKRFSKTPIDKLSDEVRLVLLMGLYQIRFLDSVKDFAAVDESVKLCKKVFPKGSGFVNGLLRNVLRDEKAFELLVKDEKKALAIEHSVSTDIVKLLVSQYGLTETKRMLRAFDEKPKIYLRVNTLKTNREELQNILLADGISAEPLESEEAALWVKGFKRLDESAAYRRGLFTVQDLSSMLTVRTMAPQPDERILDLCSCPGGKTTFAAELMGNRGSILARDISSAKLSLVKSACERLGITIVQTEASDATIFEEELANRFDRVLVDAPCSGLGILRKKPEIRYKTKEEIEPLYEIQRQILSNAAKYVKRGGVLLYSTCTVNQEENENQIRDFLHNNDFELQEEKRILMQEGESDGFYIAKLLKK